MKRFGKLIEGGLPRVVGSVIFPVSADAAAVSGEQRNTASSWVPLRPLKFRGAVRKDTESAPGAHGQHAEASPRGGMTVGAEQGFSRLAEPLTVHVVGHAVSRWREHRTVLGRRALQEAVIIRVSRIRLDDIVVHIADRLFRLDSLCSKRLEREIDQGTSRVLGQCLINLQPDLASELDLSVDSVGFEQLVCEGSLHLGSFLTTISPVETPEIFLQ